MQPVFSPRSAVIKMLFLSFLLLNATVDEETEPELHVRTATHFLEFAQYDSALVHYEIAERQLEISKDWKSLAACRTSIAEVYRIINNTSKSVEYLNSTYVICQEHFPGNSEELAKALEINGRVLDYNLREFEKAEDFYDSSLTIRKALYGKEHLTISENLYLIGRTWFNRGQNIKAEQYFNEAVAMKIKLGGENEISLFDPYTSLGALNRRLLKMDQSLMWYKKARSVWDNNKRPEDHPSIGMLEYGVGNLQIESGMYEDAKTNYRKAVIVFEKFFGEKDFRVAAAYSNIGACFSNQLEFTNAIQYYTKALTIYQEVLPENHPFIMASYGDLANAYNLFGKREEAVQYGGLALSLMEKYQSKEGNREMGFANMYHARALLNAGKLEEARRRIDIALNILETTDEQYLLGNAYTTSGSIHSALKDFEKADAHFKKALETYPDSVDRTLYLGFSLSAYGDFKRERKAYAEALALYDKSLYQLSIEVAEDGQMKALHDFQNVDVLVTALPGRGKTLLALYDTTKDQQYLHAALRNYTFLTGVYEKVIKENKSERSRLLQIPNLAAYYEQAVACALKLGELTNDPAYQQQAFTFAEQGKAIILWQYIHDSQARQFGNVPISTTQEERRLKEQLNFHDKKMDDLQAAGGFEKNDSTAIALKEEHFRLRAKYDSLVNKLETDYPSYYALKYKKTEPDLPGLTKNLKPDEAILEYLAGEKNIYAFLITAAGLEVYAFKNEPDIAIVTEGIRNGIVKRDMGIFSVNAISFYEHFFEAIDESLQLKKVRSITVVPDGVISYVPLEALLRKNDSIPDDRNANYLIRDYTFHYQYSAGLIPTYATIARENSSGEYLGFAPEFAGVQSSDERDELGPLAFNREEVDNINALLKGKSLVGQEATETNFKNLVADYSIIHLATHAVLDDQDADRSRLHFSPGDSLEDGQLHAYELFSMNIPASLVTLSACNTGTGKLHKGEGVMSLSRAFAYAGCPSMVTSLWQAQDRSTSTLMKYFYEYLSEGKNKADALTLAKLRYLNESDKVKSLPYYWSGFILVGDDAPLKKSRTTLWLIVFGCASIPLVAIIVARYNKKKSELA